MKSATWHFYSIADGRFIGVSYSGPEQWLAGNTPPGCAAYRQLKGMAFDHTAKGVNLESGRLVAVGTLETHRIAVQMSVQAAIDRAEANLARPLREVALAQATATDPPAAALARLAQADKAITAQRDRLARVESAKSHKALDAIEREGIAA